MAHVLVKNLSANAFGQVVHLINTLALVPLYLTAWGINLYGEWLLLVALPSYFTATADAGFVPVSGNDMTIKFAQGRTDEVAEIFQSAWVFTSALSLVIVAAIGGVVAAIGIEPVLGISLMPRGEATEVLLCFLVVALLNFQQGMVQVTLRAVGRYAEGTVTANVVSLGEAVATAAALLLGVRPLGVAAISLAARVAVIIAGFVLLRRHAPWLHYGIGRARARVIKELFVPSLAYLGFPAGNATMLQGTTLVLGHTLGPASVALFVTTRTITRFVIQLIGLMSWSSWPEISRHYGSGRGKLLGAFLTHGTQLAALLAIGFALAINVAARPIFAVWTNGRLEPDRLLVAILSLAAGVATLRAFPDTIIKATNRHIGYGGWYVTICVATMVIAYPLALGLGMNGVAAALAIGEIAILSLSGSIALTLIGEGLAPLRRVLTTRPPLERLLRR